MSNALGSPAGNWQSAGLIKRFPEMVELERLLETAGERCRVAVIGHAHWRELSFPLYTVAFGTTDPEAPTLALFAGVHGLERIGSQVVISFLQTVLQLLTWDETFRAQLQKTRLLFMPIVNPGGMYLQTRSNPAGVDLMRNAPVRADKMSPLFIAGGHRISPRLPWYRGPAGGPMEPEAQALCDFVAQEIFRSKVAVTLDVHSGFGAVDRLWFPYARTRKPFPSLPEVFGLKVLLDRTYPNHIYRVEPQSQQYTTHGDLWDYLYDEHRKQHQNGLFLPLSLELGSWAWVRKNFRQVFSVLGAFNPVAPHRKQRTLRRHILFFEFLHKAVMSPDSWALQPKERREAFRRRALELWYAHG
jgi:hypothetical protein